MTHRPLFARDVFAGDATTLGWLWGAAGGGAFMATIFLATRRRLPGLISAVVAGCVISALSIIVFALASTLPLAMGAMIGVGFGISVCNVGINMLLQGMAPDQLRGRVVSFFTSARFGFDALGGLFAGLLATAIGAGPSLGHHQLDPRVGGAGRIAEVRHVGTAVDRHVGRSRCRAPEQHTAAGTQPSPALAGAGHRKPRLTTKKCCAAASTGAAEITHGTIRPYTR